MSETNFRENWAEWIRMDQKKNVTFVHCMPIQITEFISYLSKSHNLKSTGNDQIQNYWLSTIPFTHRHITKEISRQ